MSANLDRPMIHSSFDSPKPSKSESVEIGALALLARLREALGDPEGKLMQDELIERARRFREHALQSIW